ncbi:hypothetical protein MMC11_003994 [Xylographa trunciseda]|nr:hypothetical protein [Xylographa trunciseda]
MLFDRKESAPIAMSHDAAAMGSNTSQDRGGGPKTSLTRLESITSMIPGHYVVPIAGGLAGAASGIVSCPLDVIKTKLQAQGGFRGQREGMSIGAAAYRGVYGTAKSIWAEEGLRGLYRGLGPMLLGYVPTWAVYLTVYNKAQGHFNTKTDNKFIANVYASLTAGACSTMVTNPIWVIKTRLMSQTSAKANGHYKPPWHYHNTLDAARKMYHGEGIKSFYSGLTPALLGLTHVAIQFPLYEIFKRKFTGIGVEDIETAEDREAHFYGLSAAVFLSKVIASTATYPHEVVRTRLQTQQRSAADSSQENFAHRSQIGKASDHGRPPGGLSSGVLPGSPRARGTIQTCKSILLEEGWRGFYAGLGTNLIRAVPSAMTTILTFEYLKRAIYHNQETAKAKLDLGTL